MTAMASPIALSIPQMDNLVVGFEGLADPYNPINWPKKKKMRTSILYSATSMASVWASTAYGPHFRLNGTGNPDICRYAPATSHVAHRFEVTAEVALLGTSLLLLG
jgi:DHA1 family multidrug resistance protein-like MFS transporter